MIMSYNWGKKALCFFVFAVLCALSAYAESCSGSGNLRYSASGCSYTTEICCHGAWASGDTCSECASGTCWNGSSCASKGSTSRSCSGNITNASGGTQTRTATCTNGSGWTYGTWSGKCTCSNNYYWSSGQGKCVACGIPPNNGAPFQYNSTTTPTAEQYKANAQMCQFKVLCLDESGWRTDPGTGLDTCVCKSGYSWDSSSQTCKKSAATYTVNTSTIVVQEGSYSSSTIAYNVCEGSTGPKNRMITGLQGAGTYGTLSVSDCPSPTKYYNFSSCATYSNGNNTYGYKFTYTKYECVAK